jgi:hypothetical protein
MLSKSYQRSGTVIDDVFIIEKIMLCDALFYPVKRVCGRFEGSPLLSREYIHASQATSARSFFLRCAESLTVNAGL